MRIWIVNYYAGSPENTTNPRYVQFSHYFQQAGHDVITFCSSFRPAAPEELIKGDGMFEEHQYGEHRYIHVRTPRYVGNGLKRMYSIWAFAWRIFRNRKKFDKPDVILHNIHTPFDYPIVWLAKRFKAKYISEAWDLWPEFFVTMGLVSRNNYAMKFFYWIEKKLYYNADQIVFTFLGAFDYLKHHGWMKEQGGKIDPKRLHYINNGINLDEFEKNKDTFPREDADVNDQNLIKIVYLGSISKANNVKTLIDAAALMQDRSNFRFFIYGNGTYREELEQYVKDNHIDNVLFKEKRITYEECAWVVSQATVNVMNYEKGFGCWGVSSGKLFQYLAAGKPIVCNVDIAYDNVIKDNNLGVCRDIETAEEFALAIRSLAEQPKEEYDAMCKRVREVAKRFDYKVLAQRELEIIENLMA